LAFAALAAGDRALARGLLEQLLRLAPEHELADEAREVLTVIEDAAKTPAQTVSVGPPPAVAEQPPSHAPKLAPERARTTGAARAELIFVQTVHGIALGGELCLMAECEDARAVTGLLMAGGGVGFAASFFGSRSGVTPGFARALTDGMLWGAANGLFVMLATDALDQTFDEGPVVGAHLALGQLLGVGAAWGLYAGLQPTTGQVSLTSSGGLWMLAVVAQVLGATEADLTEATWGLALLGASDVGLFAGGLLASRQPMSASRVLMIDAAGLLGGLTGLGLGVLLQSDSPQPGPTFALGATGTLVGLGLGYALTRRWDDDAAHDEQASVHVVPVAGGALAIGRMAF
jgi:hypothetical protein